MKNGVIPIGRIWEKLYSKNGLAAKFIAKELLNVENGERVPRISDFSTKLSLGRGTVQGALKLLEDMGAVHLESKGHLGSYLLSKDVSVLLEIAGISPLVGAMPLPYSKKYEGLATGIVEAFDQYHKRVGLAYMRGANNRLETLKTRRYDFIIISKMTAEEAMKEHAGLEIVKSFGEGSYVSAHRIFFSDPVKSRIEGGMRIGIDYSSPDQSDITLEECRNLDVELVDVNYMQLFEMLQTQQLDAAVWNVDELRSIQTFNASGFQSEQARNLARKTSEAAIVIDKGRPEVKEEFSFLDIGYVRDVQQMVEDERRLPRY